MNARRLLMAVVCGVLLIPACSPPTGAIREPRGDGFVEVERDENGEVRSESRFDRNGKLVSKVVRMAVGTVETFFGEDGKETRTVTRDKAGRIIQEVETSADPAIETEYRYDEQGRLVEVIRRERGKDILEQYDYDYDENGNLRESTKKVRKEGSEELVVEANVSFDANGRAFLAEGDLRGINRFLPNPEKYNVTEHVTEENGLTARVVHRPEGGYEFTVTNPTTGNVVVQGAVQRPKTCYLPVCPLGYDR
jgi:YD repeat-containing protein